MNKPSTAEKRAMELVDTARINQPPVPVEDLAKTLGAEITYESFDGEVSGMLYRDDDRSVIGVNSTHAPTRQRFTVAHEVGHLVMHKGKAVFIDRFVRVNWRDGTSDREEVAANAFAAELLMPRRFMHEEIQRVVSKQQGVTPQVLVAELARRFQVSPEAMSYRLTNLDILDP
jgi:Zn-dependent peptidase ImmA (M78 family)